MSDLEAMIRGIPVLASLLLLACSGKADELVIDCSAPESRSDQFTYCAPWYDAFSVESDRGLVWQEDNDFLIADHTVPTLMVLHGGGGYRLFSTGKERGTIQVHESIDGLNWTARKEPLFRPGSLPEGCGEMPLDVAVAYLPDGRYRLFVEAWSSANGLGPKPGEGDPGPAPMKLCTFTSFDAETWLHERGHWVIATNDNIWPSVLDVAWEPSTGKYSLYFVDTHPDFDGIRVATSKNAAEFKLQSADRLLPRSYVDPNPIRLRDRSGWRLYHTHDALKGQLGYADPMIGVAFDPKGKPLEGLSGQTCFTPPNLPSPPDRCMFDPAFLRLPDGRLVMYYGVFQTLPDRSERMGLARAFATD